MGIYSNIVQSRSNYKQYIIEHIENVKKAFSEYGERLCDRLEISYEELQENILNHDSSKFSKAEFDGYRQYFYTNPNEEKNQDLFDAAWLHHENANKHHPEYWVMRDDHDTKALDMPPIYIAEMLLDWQAMSYKFGSTVKSYYESQGHKKTFSDKTRDIVEDLMDLFS